MSKAATADEFAAKFHELTEPNQRYIIAIQQALLYSQEHEKQEKEKGEHKDK